MDYQQLGVAQLAVSRLPKDIPKFSGDDSTVTPDSLLNDLDLWFSLTPIAANLRAKVAATCLAGPAKQWYFVEFVPLPAAEQTYDTFQQRLRARFARTDESIVARRQQPTLRITPLNPANFMQSVANFNAAFTTNQVKIRDQGRADALYAYEDCIRNSAITYPAVEQLLTSLATAMAALPADQKTVARAMEVVAQRAPSVIDIAPPLPPVTLHAIGRAPQQAPQRQGAKRGRPNMPMSYSAAKQRGICTYCRDVNADHKSVRALNPATGQFTGRVLCKLLLWDHPEVAAESPAPQNKPAGRAMQLNSTGSQPETSGLTAGN